MIDFKILYISVLLLIGFNSYGQELKIVETESYTIDQSVQSKVDDRVTAANDIILSSMDIKMYADDSLIIDSYASGESLNWCTIISSLDGDTISIIGFYGMFGGFGYQITIYSDTCLIRYFVKADDQIYKLNKTDSLSFGISVPCEIYQLTLVNQPTFKKGDVVAGIIELTSYEFYEVMNGREKRYKVQLTGYFRTKPL